MRLNLLLIFLGLKTALFVQEKGLNLRTLCEAQKAQNTEQGQNKAQETQCLTLRDKCVTDVLGHEDVGDGALSVTT